LTQKIDYNPKFDDKHDWERKNGELHNGFAYNHPQSRRGDGGLMAANADWKNSNQTYVN
jgi:hypothetical protein